MVAEVRAAGRLYQARQALDGASGPKREAAQREVLLAEEAHREAVRKRDAGEEG